MLNYAQLFNGKIATGLLLVHATRWIHNYCYCRTSATSTCITALLLMTESQRPSAPIAEHWTFLIIKLRQEWNETLLIQMAS